MAKMRKVLAVTMAAAMTMSMLAGCGDKKTDGTEEQTVQSTERRQRHLRRSLRRRTVR